MSMCRLYPGVCFYLGEWGRSHCVCHYGFITAFRALCLYYVVYDSEYSQNTGKVAGMCRVTLFYGHRDIEALGSVMSKGLPHPGGLAQLVVEYHPVHRRVSGLIPS